MGIKTSYTPNVPKNLGPGTQSARIISMKLEAPKFDPNGYFVILDLEGPDKGPEFEGFLVDKDNPDGPRYKGQTGRVKSSRYVYTDGTTKTGRAVVRDEQIARFVSNICFAIGEVGINWLSSVDGKFDTVEELVQSFNDMIQQNHITSQYYNFTICSKEYIKDGYTKDDLYFPNYEKGMVFMENPNANPSKLIQFDPTLHVIKAQTPAVSAFEPESGVTQAVADDFSMDEDLSADWSSDDDDLKF